MRVACFCGETFESTDAIAVCPACGEPVELPKPVGMSENVGILPGGYFARLLEGNAEGQ